MNGKSADLLFHVDGLESTLCVSLGRCLIELHSEYGTQIVDRSLDIIGSDGYVTVLSEPKRSAALSASASDAVFTPT